MHSIAAESKVQRITDTLRDYIQTLNFHQTASLKLAQHTSSTAGEIAPIFMVPFERDSRYIERSEITSQLDVQLNRSHRTAIAGIGGVGYGASYF